MTDRIQQKDPPDALLMKHLLREASPDEATAAAAWIEGSAEHRRYYESLRQLWDAASHHGEADTPTEDEAWARFRARVTDSTPPARVIRWKRMAAVAAVLVALVAAGWMFVGPGRGMHAISSGNQVRQLTLPDGSRVTLNAGSTLSYATGFGKKNRRVSLEGEAFFDIAARKNLPFVAETGPLTVTVLGTRFNLNGRTADTRVVVESGRVKVTYGRQALELGPRESAVMSEEHRSLEKRAVRGALYDYYRTGTFVCDNTPLAALVTTLNEAYHARISVRDSATGSLPITTVFSASQSLDTILAIICETLDLNLTRTGNQVLIH